MAILGVILGVGVLNYGPPNPDFMVQRYGGGVHAVYIYIYMAAFKLSYPPIDPLPNYPKFSIREIFQKSQFF